MAAKVFEKSAEETAFRAVLKEVYESGKNSVAVLWADAALSARFQETLYAFLLKDVLGSAAAGVKLRALCAFCGGEAETAQNKAEWDEKALLRLERILKMDDCRAAAELSACANRAKTRLKKSAALLAMR